MFIEYNGEKVSVKHNNTKYETYNVTVRLHVSTLTESSSGPHDTDPYKECTMHCGIPTLTISVAYLHVLIVIHSHCHSLQTYLQHTYMFSLSFTLTVIHYRHICSIHTCSHCHSLSLSLTTDISVAYIHVLIVIHSHCHSLQTYL